MKVSDLLVRCLEDEGVTYVFGLPGEENEDMLFSLESSSIQFVPTRHEQGAAFMAGVWGRLTGKPGVCLSTLGPGATNLLTGIADAFLDKSPLVAITGQGALGRLHHESHQRLDIVNMFRPVTKWNTAVTDADSVSEIVRKAFKVATQEKPGATHIELPEDVAGQETEMSPLPITEVRRPTPHPASIDEATEFLAESRRPLILVGNGAIRTGASEALTALAHHHRIPVVHTFMGKGAVSDRHDESLMVIGLKFRDIVVEAVDAADLIIAVGYDPAECDPDSWNTREGRPVIHIDTEPADVYASYTPEVEVVGDIAEAISQLHRKLHQRNHRFDTEWYKPVRRALLEDIYSYDLKEDEPFTVPGVLNLVRPLLGDEDLLISDVGMHKLWVARNFPTYSPNSVLICNGLASMGFAVPGALAASLQNPERKVIAAVGDGGFLMNSQELETAHRLGVGFTTLVFRNNDYGLIRFDQEMHKGESTGTRIGNPDFKLYAESYGLKGYRPRTLEELRAHLEEAIGSSDLSVIEIPVSSTVNHDLVNKGQKSELIGGMR